MHSAWVKRGVGIHGPHGPPLDPPLHLWWNSSKFFKVQPLQNSRAICIRTKNLQYCKLRIIQLPHSSMARIEGNWDTSKFRCERHKWWKYVVKENLSVPVLTFLLTKERATERHWESLVFPNDHDDERVLCSWWPWSRAESQTWLQYRATSSLLTIFFRDVWV